MNKTFGEIIYWILWPLIWIYAPLILRCRVLVVADGKVLLVKGTFGPDRWSLPGGGKHFKETQDQAARRELEEETTIKVPISKFKPIITNKRCSQDGLTLRYSIFLVELDNQQVPTGQKGEIAEVAWKKLADLYDEPLGTDVQEALRAWND